MPKPHNKKFPFRESGSDFFSDSKQIKEVADPTLPQDAVTLNHLQNSLPIFGTEFQFIESLPVAVSTSVSFVNKLDFTTSSLPPGNYKVEWSYGWNHDSSKNDFVADLSLDNIFTIDDLIMIHRQRPRESGGIPLGRFISTATGQNFMSSGFRILNLSGIHNFKLRFRTDTIGDESSIWDASLIIYRIS